MENRMDRMDLIIEHTTIRVLKTLLDAKFENMNLETTTSAFGENVINITIPNVSYIMKINGRLEIAQNDGDTYGTPDYRIASIDVKNMHRVYTIGL